MRLWNAIVIALLALLPIVMAQNPIEAFTGSVQEQISTAGEQLQEKVVQHAVEGNLTQDHFSQEINDTMENLTEQAKKKIDQNLNENLNLTPEQLQQKATEELEKQVSQRVQQPGFEYALAVASILGTAFVLRRRR